MTLKENELSEFSDLGEPEGVLDSMQLQSLLTSVCSMCKRAALNIY